MRDTPPCSPPVRRADCGPKLGVRGAVDFDQCSVDISVQIARGRSFVITLMNLLIPAEDCRRVCTRPGRGPDELAVELASPSDEIGPPPCG